MLQFSIDENGDIEGPEIQQLSDPLSILFPWMEYLVRAGWTPDGRYVHAQLLDRQQQKMQLILIPYHSFDCHQVLATNNQWDSNDNHRHSTKDSNHRISSSSSVNNQRSRIPEACVKDSSASAESGISQDMQFSQGVSDVEMKSQSLPPCDSQGGSFGGSCDNNWTGHANSGIQVIYEDTSDIWVNVHDILYFFPQEEDSQLQFLWSSEKSGYRHLYLVAVAVHGSGSSQQSAMDMLDRQTDSSSPRVLYEIPLTSGDWEVCGKQVWVDEARQLVYFIGYKDTPLESHLYVVSYEKPGIVTRLTELGSSHTVSMDGACNQFVSVYSSVSQLPASKVFSLHHHSNGDITAHSKATLLIPHTLSEDYHPPELFHYDGPDSGVRNYGMVYPPHDREEGRQYPTVLFVYGGPQVQLVTNAYKGLRFLRLHTLASLGYAVVTIDTRGSCHRGLQFESHIKGQMGQVELADQVEGLRWLASQVDYIDLTRVAIHGWSYGGYLSLIGLAQWPHVFRVAVAGAPVTSWNLYDTGYTERYLDMPQCNPEGYKQGSLLHYVDNFPSEENRLLIIHGLIDENVHFFHTSHLVNALIKAGKPYQLQVYPNERHGIRNPDASEHYETMVLSFLQQHL